MKKINLGILGLLLGLVVFNPSLRAEDDWQYWNLVQIKSELSEKWTWRVFSEQWLNEDFSNFYLTNVDTGLTWKPGKYYSLGGFYRYQSVTPENADSTAEHRYYPEVTFFLPTEHLKFSDRSRFEYHDTNRRDFWQFRNRFQISYPTKIKKLPITPYVDEELFYSTATGSINENRVSAGVTFKLGSRVDLSLYYLVRHTRKRADWQSAQVLGTTWTLKI
jgi:hypothetical protein